MASSRPFGLYSGTHPDGTHALSPPPRLADPSFPSPSTVLVVRIVPPAKDATSTALAAPTVQVVSVLPRGQGDSPAVVSRWSWTLLDGWWAVTSVAVLTCAILFRTIPTTITVTPLVAGIWIGTAVMWGVGMGWASGWSDPLWWTIWPPLTVVLGTVTMMRLNDWSRLVTSTVAPMVTVGLFLAWMTVSLALDSWMDYQWKRSVADTTDRSLRCRAWKTAWTQSVTLIWFGTSLSALSSIGLVIGLLVVTGLQEWTLLHLAMTDATTTPPLTVDGCTSCNLCPAPSASSSSKACGWSCPPRYLSLYRAHPVPIGGWLKWTTLRRRIRLEFITAVTTIGYWSVIWSLFALFSSVSIALPIDTRWCPSSLGWGVGLVGAQCLVRGAVHFAIGGEWRRGATAELAQHDLHRAVWGTDHADGWACVVRHWVTNTLTNNDRHTERRWLETTAMNDEYSALRDAWNTSQPLISASDWSLTTSDTERDTSMMLRHTSWVVLLMLTLLARPVV